MTFRKCAMSRTVHGRELKEATIQGTALWYATTQEAADALAAVAAGLNNGVIQPVV
ncbi:hypothetical protein AB0J47_40695 [Nocardia sp. NPDC049737]|uniref:hypothetical protein n=1 Tax=Nocardia sp. NPDC049737 TaxID=3154358 RepID=UPI003434E2E5